MADGKNGMTPSSRLCIDASLITRLLLNKAARGVRERWLQWQHDGVNVVAPTLLKYEMTNAIHREQMAGLITDATASNALTNALRLKISYFDDVHIHDSAIRLARRFNRPAAYDAHYLALAESLGVEFWTLDERLYNAVQHQLPWVRFAGEGAGS